jgi:hypothetical protein
MNGPEPRAAPVGSFDGKRCNDQRRRNNKKTKTGRGISCGTFAWGASSPAA